jgi:superfamily II DNA or RNA helicase
MNNSYFGKKGYTIYKNSISLDQHCKIRNDLTVSPFVPKGSFTNSVSFPIYRESNSKFYLPKYYGISKFGYPKTSTTYNYNTINLTFNGSLRDYQVIITDKFLDNINNNGFGGLLEVGCGQGKTVMALYLISKLNIKTLIIVHKEFLMNQWIERINYFLPNAKIGKIQGQIIDINDKDIVIGMLQSLSMKDYPDNLFDSFGFTIIDETHHIGAEVFVRSLFKVTTKYMLGLSATMNRKDGLTKVFKMFIGDIIYKYIDEQQHNVLVNIYNFRSPCPTFNEDILTFQGKPQYSSMISKISEFNSRSEFIIKIISNIFNNNPNQQLIILAHNKSLLNYLYESINHKNIANSSIGYYIGGMKENDLKISENKSIILATYAMAAEALDIKTLTTLLMASPKTDVTQSIGRILRTKHVQPLVIDIADYHDIFQAQLKKRITYYKKQQYTIHIYANNDIFNYTPLDYKKTNNKHYNKSICLI